MSPEVALILPLLDDTIVQPPIMAFKTQAYLERKGAGIARLRLPTPDGPMILSAWLNHLAGEFRLQIPYLLTVLQAEQNLLHRTDVPPVEFQVKTLPGEPANLPASRITKDPKPAAPGPGWFVVRNGGPKYTDDGNWYLAVNGDKKLFFALGAGAPDEYFFPTWDVRKYGGLANQLRKASQLLRQYLDEWAKLSTSSNPADTAQLLVRVYSGELVRPADGATYALLRYNPDLNGLRERPAIYTGIVKEAKAWALA